MTISYLPGGPFWQPQKRGGLRVIILALALMAASIIVFILFNRQKEAVWLTGMFLGFALVNIGLLFYYAKMGGLTPSEQVLFFLTGSIQGRLQRMPVTLDAVAQLLTAGRYLFVTFVLLFALDLGGRLRRRWLLPAALIWPLASLATTSPALFRLYNYDQRRLCNTLAEACLNLYLFIALFLLAREYGSHTIGWIRRQLRYILLFVVNLTVYFFFLGRVNPVSIFYPDGTYGLSFGMLPLYRLHFSLSAWIAVILLFLAFMAIGLIALFQYARVNLAESQEEVSLERQFDTANMGTRVFMHGIKNQLLSEQILLDQMRRQLREGAPPQALDASIEELQRINQGMNSRMEALYKVFRHNAMTLVPTRVTPVIQRAMAMSAKRLDRVDCSFSALCDPLILADPDYLSEAICNLLVNAVDAIEACSDGRRGKIELTLQCDHNWCAVRLEDNGVGIERGKLKKIFEPFYTEKNTNFSWGVGLSYVKQTVKCHFGRLLVESTPGEGTVFTLALPQYLERTKRKEAP